MGTESLGAQGARGRAKKTDLRVIRSREAIKAAALRIVSRPGDADITARDVADEALVNKKTFLAHYGSVSAVLDELEREAVAEATRLVGDGADAGEEGLRAACERVAAASRDKATALGALLTSRLRPELMGQMRRALAERIDRAAKAAGRIPAHARYASDFVAGGVVSIFERWLDDESRPAPSEFADVVVGYARASVLPGGASGVESGGILGRKGSDGKD